MPDASEGESPDAATNDSRRLTSQLPISGFGLREAQRLPENGIPGLRGWKYMKGSNIIDGDALSDARRSEKLRITLRIHHGIIRTSFLR